MTQPTPEFSPRQEKDGPVDVGTLFRIRRRSKTFKTPSTQSPHSLNTTPPVFIKTSDNHGSANRKAISLRGIRIVSAHSNYAVRLAVRHQTVNNVPMPSLCRHQVRHRATPSRHGPQVVCLRHRETPSRIFIEQHHRAAPTKYAIEQHHRAMPLGHAISSAIEQEMMQSHQAAPLNDVIE